MATNYAAMCNFSHGHPEEPLSPYPDVGQNLYATSNKKINYRAAVWKWFGENKNYDFATQVCSGKTCDHYTQVNSNLAITWWVFIFLFCRQLVWADSILLGCGHHYCNGPIAGTPMKEGYLVVCNYVPPWVLFCDLILTRFQHLLMRWLIFFFFFDVHLSYGFHGL